ncbi:MAG: hypothetical protein Q9171_005540 [Xanthocarpia ochracea]
MALREKNILSGFKTGGLYPYAPSHVLRHLPPPPSTNDMASLEKGMQNLMLTQATPQGFQLYKTNAALRRMLASPDVSERMEAQLAIAEKEAKEREVLLQARKRQRTGKRLVIKDQIILSTMEIMDGVKAAEAETQAKKKKKGKKGKTIEDPVVIASGDKNE